MARSPAQMSCLLALVLALALHCYSSTPAALVGMNVGQNEIETDPRK